MDNKAKVKMVLEGLDLGDIEVRILENRGTRVLAAITSPSFEGMNEAERQALVWGKLIDDLGDYESRRVEFVFTDTPRELAEAISESNANEAATKAQP
jgi:acid stress-induced BolA-like protein IbaG/YrbA